LEGSASLETLLSSLPVHVQVVIGMVRVIFPWPLILKECCAPLEGSASLETLLSSLPVHVQVVFGMVRIIFPWPLILKKNVAHHSSIRFAMDLF
jgi:hypothetical protein